MCVGAFPILEDKLNCSMENIMAFPTQYQSRPHYVTRYPSPAPHASPRREHRGTNPGSFVLPSANLLQKLRTRLEFAIVAVSGLRYHGCAFGAVICITLISMSPASLVKKILIHRLSHSYKLKNTRRSFPP